MLEGIEGDNGIEGTIAKRQSMRVGGDIGVAEQRVFQFDDVGDLVNRATGADIQRPAVELAQPIDDVFRRLIADVSFRHDFHGGRIVQEHRPPCGQRKRTAAALTAERVLLTHQRAAAVGASREAQNCLEAVGTMR